MGRARVVLFILRLNTTIAQDTTLSRIISKNKGSKRFDNSTLFSNFDANKRALG